MSTDAPPTPTPTARRARVRRLCQRLAAGLLAAAACSLGAHAMNPQHSEQALRQYELGQRLADCLARGCSIFIGRVQAVGAAQPAPGERDPRRAMQQRSVDLQLRQWLHGQPEGKPGDALRLQQLTEPAQSKTALGPWQAWEGARPEPGGELLAARWAAGAARPSWLGQPEDVALAVTEPGLQAALREALARHHALQRQPDEVQRLPQLLRERNDALFTGYALTVLMNGGATPDTDRAATLLAGLLGQPALPAPANALLADWLAGGFYRLAEATRRSLTQALVAQACADDAGPAQAALDVLLRLSDAEQLDLRPAPSPARRRKLIDLYRAHQARHPAAHAQFEAQLGVR